MRLSRKLWGDFVASGGRDAAPALRTALRSATARLTHTPEHGLARTVARAAARPQSAAEHIDCPVWGLHSPWQAASLPIAQDLASTWVRDHGELPIGVIAAPEVYLALLPMPRLDGSWGVAPLPIDHSGRVPWIDDATHPFLERLRALQTVRQHPPSADTASLDGYARLKWESLTGHVLRLNGRHESAATDTITDPHRRDRWERWRLGLAAQRFGRWADTMDKIRNTVQADVVRACGAVLPALKMLVDFTSGQDIQQLFRYRDMALGTLPLASDVEIRTDLAQLAARRPHAADALALLSDALQRLRLLAFDLDERPDDPNLRSCITSWQRDPVLDAAIGVWAGAEDLRHDPDTTILLHQGPHGLPIGALAVWYRRHYLTGAERLHAAHLAIPTYPYGPVHTELIPFVSDLADLLGIDWEIDEERTFQHPGDYRRFQGDSYPWIGLHNSAAPLQAEQIVRHPHSTILPGLDGSYEAVQPTDTVPAFLPDSLVRLQPRLGADPLRALSVEIVPHPLQGHDTARLPHVYVGDTGRGAIYDLGPEGVHYDDVTWQDLSVIGIQRTQTERTTSDPRDGETDLYHGRQRLFWSWLLHTIGRHLGLRVPLTIGVLNRGRQRGSHDVARHPPRPDARSTNDITSSQAASACELHRTRLRLHHLNGDLEHDRRLVAVARSVLAREFGPMDEPAYVTWLTKSLGRQLAVLYYLRLDHGEFKGEGQLDARNVSLAGEFCDLETMRRLPASDADFILGFRYVTSGADTGGTHIHLARMAMQQAKVMDGQEASDRQWLGHLLALAPGIKFAGLAARTYKRTLTDLNKRRFSYEAALREFLDSHWRPWIRAHRSALTWRRPATTAPIS